MPSLQLDNNAYFSKHDQWFASECNMATQFRFIK